MPLVLIFIGGVLVVSALRNSQGELATALMQDVPRFMTWAAAILAVGAIGFVPKMQPVSRALLGLILVVLVLKNYQGILSGFTSAASASASKPPATPAAAVAKNVGSAGWASSGNGGMPSGIGGIGALGGMGSGLGGGFGMGGGASGMGMGALG